MMRLSVSELHENYPRPDVIAILARCRGRRLYLPVCRHRAAYQLQRRFGLPVRLAGQLAATYHGQEIIFPKATQLIRRWAVARLSALGLAADEISLMVNISPRTVKRQGFTAVPAKRLKQPAATAYRSATREPS